MTRAEASGERGAGASGERAAEASSAALVDAHCHLNHERFGPEAAAVAAAARAAGVVRLLVPGWNVASSERAVALVRELGWVDAAVGIHPHDAAKVGEADWARLERFVDDPAVVAVGETGLDFDRCFSPVEAQLENLERHADIARRTGKPLILHCRSKAGRRDAQDALLDGLRRWFGGGEGRSAGPERPRPGLDRSATGLERPPVRFDRPPAVLHSFSGPLDYALAALELGCLVSFSGLVFRAGEEASAEVARLAPEEALLVETDAPFLAPPGGPKGRNEPARVVATARWLAELRGVDLRSLGPRLVATYDGIFRVDSDRTSPGGEARPVRPRLAGSEPLGAV